MGAVGRPRKFKSASDMEKGIKEYFAECDEREEPYTFTGLALALGFEDRRSLLDYQSYVDSEGNEYSRTIKRAKTLCEQNIEKGLLTGKYNSAGAIFNLKNNYGWKDKTEVENSGNMNNTITVKLDGDVSEWGK